MGFRKFQSVEKTDVLSDEEHGKIKNALKKLNKTSAKQLTDEEREKLSQLLDK